MYNTREVFRAGEIAIPPDEELIGQLAGIRYKTEQNTGLIEIESKEEMTERHVKSPDCAWSLALALWGAKRMKTNPNIRPIGGRRQRGESTTGDTKWY
jgi:hypothetical protein